MIKKIQMDINRLGINIQEFFAVKEDIKPVLRTGTESRNIGLIKEFCKKHNLHLLIKPTGDIPSITDNISTYPYYILYISSSSKLVKQAFDAEKNRDEKN